MTALSFIVLLLVLWTIKEVILGVLVWRRRRQLSRKLRVESTLHHFAEARNQLMLLALEKKIDTNSRTFRSLYNMNTFIMRRPDAYPEISAMLRYVFLVEGKSDRDFSWHTESKTWSPEIKEVVKASADAMGYLVINYSRLIRMMYRIERRINPKATPRHILERLSSREEKKDPVVKEIRATQEQMYRLAAA